MIQWCWDWLGTSCNIGALENPVLQDNLQHTQSITSTYYNNPGTYFVNQYAYNSLYSDNYDDPIPVIVHPKPDPGFNVPNIPICKNIPAYFTNTSSITLFQ